MKPMICLQANSRAPGVRIVASQKVFSGGNLQTTTQPLDLAISGHGFFQVQLPDGTSAYTAERSVSTEC